MRKKEKERISDIAKVYFSEELLGLNEQYHLTLRDLLIPRYGGKSALELGCGNGLWTKVLCQRYGFVDVVDGSEQLIKNLENQVNINVKERLRTYCELVENFTKEAVGKKWQHIYAIFLLEHIKDPTQLLIDIKSHLEHKGKLFIAVPNADSVHRVIAYRAGLINTTEELSKNDKKVGHRRVYTRDLLIYQLQSAGFNIIEEKNIGLKPVSLKQMKDYSDTVVKAFCEAGDLVPQNSAYLAIVAGHKS